MPWSLSIPPISRYAATTGSGAYSRNAGSFSRHVGRYTPGSGDPGPRPARGRRRGARPVRRPGPVAPAARPPHCVSVSPGRGRSRRGRPGRLRQGVQSYRFILTRTPGHSRCGSPTFSSTGAWIAGKRTFTEPAGSQPAEEARPRDEMRRPFGSRASEPDPEARLLGRERLGQGWPRRSTGSKAGNAAIFMLWSLW